MGSIPFTAISQPNSNEKRIVCMYALASVTNGRKTENLRAVHMSKASRPALGVQKLVDTCWISKSQVCTVQI